MGTRSKRNNENLLERTARAFSTFVNILDPDVIVCGGGMSDIDELYTEVPNKIIPYLASDIFLTPIVKLNTAQVG